MKLDLISRVMATQKTVDAFKEQRLKAGKADCVQLVILHAGHMGRTIAVPRYTSWKTAAEALRSMGFSTLGEAMDHHFERIEPVNALAGDFIEMPGTNGFSGLTVAVGNGRVLGFHEQIPHADILQPLITTGAWRIG